MHWDERPGWKMLQKCLVSTMQVFATRRLLECHLRTTLEPTAFR